MNQQQPQSAFGQLVAQAGGLPGAFGKHSTPGDTVDGTIDSVDIFQDRDYRTGDPLYWDDGKPRQKIQIVLNTDQRDPSIDNDTGKRAVYVKWWGQQRKNLLEAIRKANDTDLRPGGLFRATYTHQDEPRNPREDGEKQFGFDYRPPAPSSGVGFAAAQPEQPQAAPQQQTAPAQHYQQQAFAQPAQPPQQQPQQQPAAAAPSAPQAPAGDPWGTGAPVAPQTAAQPAVQAGVDPATADKVKALLGIGFDDAQITQTVGVDAATIAQVRASMS